jgi:replicative superfamily II helicase
MSEKSFEEMLSSVTNNPDLMKKISQLVENNKNGEISDTLPDVLSLLSSHIKSTDDEKKPIVDEEKSEKEEDTPDLNVVKMVGSLSKEISKSTKLLLAIKPYLSQGRQDMIGNILKLSSLSNVLNLLG